MKRTFDFDLQLFASAAGLNAVVKDILWVNPNSTKVTSPLGGYGNASNDSGAIYKAIGGMIMVEAKNFTKWKFMYLGGGSGYTITLYGTNSPLAWKVWRAVTNPGPAAIQGLPTLLPASEWTELTSPDIQTGTGASANPLTASAQLLDHNGPLLAVRAVLTDVSDSPSGVVHIACEAVP